jgi:hypothetical protein
MGSDEIHEDLSIKSHKIQWDLMKFMRFKYQILWNQIEFYDDLIDSSHIQIFMVQSCLLLRGGQEN